MPIYEYRCATCGFEKEYLQKLSDAPITHCESCGRPTMAKLVSAAGFQLKGSGWYATDFKNNGSRPKAKEESKTDGGAAAGDTGKTAGETKNAAECGAGACAACQPVQ
ncbi:MAG TPA: zinc ribbon domain-containing protein [Burkholderiales bacterium]|nr:zinc ribbon domain-containing protein [Burkholderiales bacterium]